MADKARYSIGLSWPGDVLRRLIGARGAWSPPDRYTGQLYPVVELRPQLPYEFFRAGWVVGTCTRDVPAVAAQFGTVILSNPADSGRAAILTRMRPSAAAGLDFGLYVNRPFIAPNVGSGVADSRWTQGATGWLTPMKFGTQVGAAVATPPAGDRVDLCRNPNINDLGNGHGPLVLMPGVTVEWWALTVNLVFSFRCDVMEIPVEDLGG